MHQIHKAVQASDASEPSRGLGPAELAAIVESSDDAILAKSLDGTILSWNAGAQRVFGYAASEVIGKPIALLVPPDRLDEEREILEQIKRGQRVEHLETVRLTRDGRALDVSMTVSPLKDRAGNIVGASNVARDITEHKRAEEALRQSELRLKLALLATETGIWDFNPLTGELNWDARCKELFGLPPHVEVNYDTFLAGLHPEDRQRTHEAVQNTFNPASGGVFDIEYRTVGLQDGGVVRWVRATGRASFSDRGQAIRFIGTIADITRHKTAEEALRQTHERMQKVLEVETVGVMFWDLNTGCLVDANDTFLKMMGYSRSDLEARDLTWQKFTPPEYYEASRAEVAKFMATGRVGPYEKEYLRKDGTRQWLLFAGSSLGNNQCVEFCVDISERKKVEDELNAAKVAAEQAKAVAEDASRAKDQFLAVLSHELRTPLTPAVAALTLLRGDARLPQDVREDLAMVSRNLDLEVRLIADLLDVSRVIAGKLHLERRPIDVAAAIRQAVAIVDGEVDAKGQSVTIQTPGAPYLIHADAARLQQVFWNLLRNSSKFSPAGGTIVVRARVVPVDHCPLVAEACPVGFGPCPSPQAAGVGNDAVAPFCTNLIIDVVDQGSGIAPEMLPRLFKPFEQEQKARAFGGLGLGLSICKAVVEMHGGSISAYSDGPGRGATFTVRLPVAQCPLDIGGERPPPQDTAAADAPPARVGELAPRVLLVEDHPDTAKALQRLLTSEGFDVRVAGNVADALAAATTQPPDALVSDLGLPDGTGMDLLRQLFEGGHRIPAIALSGYGSPADVTQSRAAGFAEHLTKPLNGIEQLTAALARLSVRPQARQPHPQGRFI